MKAKEVKLVFFEGKVQAVSNGKAFNCFDTAEEAKATISELDGSPVKFKEVDEKSTRKKTSTQLKLNLGKLKADKTSSELLEIKLIEKVLMARGEMAQVSVEKPIRRKRQNKITSLKDAIDIASKAKARIGSIASFVPFRSKTPIKGTVKAITIDARVNRVYYRLIGLEDKKMYHTLVIGGTAVFDDK